MVRFLAPLVLLALAFGSSASSQVPTIGCDVASDQPPASAPVSPSTITPAEPIQSTTEAYGFSTEQGQQEDTQEAAKPYATVRPYSTAKPLVTATPYTAPKPTPKPYATSTPYATPKPTTCTPTIKPTTRAPTSKPYAATTQAPTRAPTQAPTPVPTRAPTQAPAMASTGLGTCYEPMHSQLYPLNGGDGSRLREILDRDLLQLSQRFSTLRTYHAQYYGVRIAEYAAKYKLKLYIGLAKFPQNPEWEEEEVKAAVEGAKQYPGTVQAIIIGSEDLVQAGGDQTVDAVISRVKEIKQRLSAAGVSDVLVGTSQRINELTNSQIAGDIDRLVAACDFVGVNIYPFFSTGYDVSNPAGLLDAQWAQLRTRFPSSMAKLRVTETGWPSAGAAPSAFPRNVPSGDTQRAYFQAVAKWQPQDKAGPHFWFMAYDRRSDDRFLSDSGHFERYFGVYTSDNQDKGVF